MPEYRKVEASNLTKESIYLIAESVAQQLKYVPGGDLVDVLRKLGGRIAYHDVPGSDSGSCFIESEGDFTIYLAHDTSIARDRFTIAHEIGHYILHYLLPKKKMGADPGPTMAYRYGSERAEWEANWFAAAFLMPEKAFRRAAAEHKSPVGINISSLAAKFGVSMMAAQVRAKALGLE